VWTGVGLAGLLLAGACAPHEAEPAFRRTVFIDDRGISVPLPPPSLVDAPQQDVDVDAQALGEDPVLAGTMAHVEDMMGDGTAELELPEGAQHFTIEGLPVDLTDNCLELWLVAPDGREGEHVVVHAEIVPDDDDEDTLESIATKSGC
jgi:hypothetical protein